MSFQSEGTRSMLEWHIKMIALWTQHVMMHPHATDSIMECIVKTRWPKLDIMVGFLPPPHRPMSEQHLFLYYCIVGIIGLWLTYSMVNNVVSPGQDISRYVQEYIRNTSQRLTTFQSTWDITGEADLRIEPSMNITDDERLTDLINPDNEVQFTRNSTHHEGSVGGVMKQRKRRRASTEGSEMVRRNESKQHQA